jgi:hypothetical protein
MRRSILVIKIIVLLLALLASVGCGISRDTFSATMEAEVRPAVATEARRTAEAEIETVVPATLTAVAATQEVVLMSFHGQYVTAMGVGGGWLLRQEPDLGDCGWFTLQHLGNGKVSLMTCHNRYVTAPRTGATRKDWVLWQDSELGECGQFVLHESSEGVAFETCAGRFFTAGEDSWEPGLEWSVIAETFDKLAWELFTVLRR